MRGSLILVLCSSGLGGKPWCDPAIHFDNHTFGLRNNRRLVAPDPSRNYGRWDGWGVSLCWWANIFGDNDNLADALFSLETVTVGDEQLPGLGFNIARYNAGGSAWREASGETMSASPNIPKFKQIEGFWQDYESQDPDSSSWNWDADAKQRAMLQKAKERGADQFELFSNSPTWWMLYNHNPAGSNVGFTDNLQSWNQRNHSVYLATIAAHARDEWGIDFNSVEPLNEPFAAWWHSLGTQEGCHFARSTQRSVVQELRQELDARGLQSALVSASDENTYDEARGTWGEFDVAAKAAVGRVNVHGYQGTGGRRDLLFQDVAADGKPLWNSEYGDGDGSGMSMARNLNLDFQWLHSTAYVYWQALDESDGWGLMKFDSGSMQVQQANTKFFVLAHYSRHIRPGMTIIESNDGDTVVAHDANSGTLVVVCANYDDEKDITYDLSALSAPAGSVRRWSTIMMDGGERYFQYDDVEVDDHGRLVAHFAKTSIQTFEVHNVHVQQVTFVRVSV